MDDNQTRHDLPLAPPDAAGRDAAYRVVPPYVAPFDGFYRLTCGGSWQLWVEPWDAAEADRLLAACCP